MAVKSLEIEGRILFVAKQELQRSPATVRVGQAAYNVQRAQLNELAELQQLLDTYRPDVLILDMALAQAFGAEGCTQLKRSASAPLLVIASAPPHIAEAEHLALLLGADDTLKLPWRPTKSLARLRGLLRLHRQNEKLRQQNHQLRQELAERELRLKVAQTTSQEYSVLRDSIVHNAVHEMSTPLLQLKSSVSMLDSALRDAPVENNIPILLDFAKQALTRLENVLENFRHLARSLDLKVEPMRVEDSISLAMRALSRRWSSADKVHRVRTQVASDLPAVLSDKQAIAQVLQQLIDNALKFSPDEQPVEVIAQRTADGVRLSVRDRGIGMEAEQTERIFKEFYQTDSGSQRRFSGSGIGLAIVKLILERLGVPIQVESQVNVGSTFSFTLKAAPLR
ncbi:MAG: hybrid sensor histidine kinase/response regulator [Chloroflexi bacterium]|jgi:signal transduction histidine kinase|nr:hybrid sensor histidine kinase/response regulator [Chloroflexota bacterium]